MAGAESSLAACRAPSQLQRVVFPEPQPLCPARICTAGILQQVGVRLEFRVTFLVLKAMNKFSSWKAEMSSSG